MSSSSSRTLFSAGWLLMAVPVHAGLVYLAGSDLNKSVQLQVS
jgi:hypothetical protein